MASLPRYNPLPVAQQLTNIGTTFPPPAQPLTEEPQRFLPNGLPIARRLDTQEGVHQHVRPGALPVALPVARTEEEGPGEKLLSPDPLWVSRWQPSKTVPLSRAPWIVGYRWWIPGPAYDSIGEIQYHRIDLKFKADSKGYSHEHAYIVHPELYFEFRNLQTSVGEWLHERILGPKLADGTYSHNGYVHWALN